MQQGLLAGLWILRGTGIGAGLRTSAVLALASAVLLPVAHPLATLFQPACDAFSSVYAGAALAAFAVWGVIALAARRLATMAPATRAVAGATAATAALAGLALAFPECRGGPYGAVDPRLVSLWMDAVGEALPVHRLFAGSPWWIPVYLIAPLAGIGYALVQIRRGAGRRRLLWAIQTAFLVAATGLSFWQQRTLMFAGLYLAPAVAAMAGMLWRFTAARPLLPRACLRAAILLLFGPMLGMVLPNLVVKAAHRGNGDAQDVAKGLKAMADDTEPCDLRKAAALLSDPAGFGGRPRTVMAPIDFGPELLYRTPHAVLAAPYHRNAAGNLDAIDFFLGPESAARAIAQRRGVSLIVTCRHMPELDGYANIAPDGMAARLIRDRPPAWLKPIETGSPDVQVYGVADP
jgi:hypothetical protein